MRIPNCHPAASAGQPGAARHAMGNARKAVNAALSGVLLLALLAACAPLPERPDEAQSASPAESEQSSEPRLQQQVRELTAEDLKPLPATDPEVLFNVLAGEQALHHEDYALAADHYERAAALSDDPDIAERATRIALYTGRADSAREAVEQWLTLMPDAEAAHLAAARLYLGDEDPQQAVPHLAAVVEAGEDVRAAWQSVAQLLVSAQLGEQAIDLMTQVMEMTGATEDPDVIHLQGQMSAQIGDLMFALVLADREIALRPSAEAHAWRGRLNSLAGEPQAALEDLAQAVSMEPDNSELQVQYAGLLQAEDRFEEAQQVLAALPQDEQVLFTRAVYALGAEDESQAEVYYNQLAQLEDPPSSHQSFLLAQLAELLKREDAARSWYLKVAPGEDFGEARMRLALLLSRADRLDDAREVLIPLHHLDPQQAIDAFLLESQLLVEAQREAESFEILNRGLALYPDDIDLLYGRALAAEGLDRIDQAEWDLRRILELQPDNPTALNALGYTLADRTDRYEEALELISRAYEMRPGEAAIVDSMGWVHYRLGNLELAEDFLRQALDIQFDGEIAAHLGEVLWVQGREDEALVIWLDAMAQAPDSESLMETIERLAPGLDTSVEEAAGDASAGPF